MKERLVHRKIKTLHQQIDALQCRIRADPAQMAEGLTEAFAVVHNTLEELQITEEELAAARQAVEVEHQRYRELFEFAPDGYVVTDATGTIREANSTAAALLHVSQSSLVGKPLAIFIVKEERKSFRTQLARLSQLERVQNWEVSFQPRGGMSFPALITTTAVRDPREEMVRLYWLIRDITDRKQTTEALQEGDAKIRAILEATVDGIIMINEQGIIEVFNPAAERIFGYTAAEAIGQNISILMPSPYREEHDCYLAHYRTTGKKKIIGIGREVVGQHKDGTVFLLDLAINEVHVSNRRLFVGIVRDLTERKRMEQELLQAEKFSVIGEVASALAHEIGTPLGVVSGTVEFLMTETTDPESPKELEVIVSQTDRISTLMRQLLTFARPQDDTLEQVDIHKYLERALRLLEYRFQKERIQVVKAFHPQPLLLLGVSNQLEQVFLNLLVNAWHAMPAGGTLTISTALQDQVIVLQFQDTGQGILPEHLPQIFAPFFTTKGSNKGTGLGLSICQQIITRHNGNIEVESAVGKGSLFTVKLPRNQKG